MLALVNTNEKLQIVLAGAVLANELHAIVHYSDKTTTAYIRGANRVLVDDAVDVDLLTAPASGVLRDIDSINVYQRDTASAIVTIKIDIAGTEYILGSWTLSPGDVLHYTHGSGWQVLDQFGQHRSITTTIVSSTDRYYEHTQSAPATTWTVTHSLGKKPSVSIADNSGNLVRSDVHYIDNNSLTVNFAAAMTGKAYCN